MRITKKKITTLILLALYAMMLIIYVQGWIFIIIQTIIFILMGYCIGYLDAIEDDLEDFKKGGNKWTELNLKQNLWERVNGLSVKT